MTDISKSTGHTALRSRFRLPLAAAGGLSAVLLWSLGLVTTPGPFILAVLTALALAGLTVSVTAAVRLVFAQRGDRGVSGRSAARIACAALGVPALALLPTFFAGVFSSRSEVEAWSFAPDRREASKSLRIVCFNVLHGYPGFRGQEERFRTLRDSLRALSPDLVILQEAWSTRTHGALAERLARELGMDSVYARANGSLRFLGFEEGSAILSRHRILEARRLPLSPRLPSWENRIALEARIDAGGAPLAVAGTHLTFMSGEWNRRQAESLSQRLAGTDVVAGDFNAGDGSAAVRIFAARGFVDAVPGGIDHVLLSSGSRWKLESARWTLGAEDLPELIGYRARLSDHRGILVDLRLP